MSAIGENAFDYRKGWEAEPEAGARSLAAKAPYEDFRAEPLDARRYYAPEFMRLEEEKLWPQVWLMAGFTCDILRPGNYLRFDMIVARDATTPWRANWKTVLDAFNEAYHAFFVHSMTRKSFDDYHTQIDTYANGMNRRIGMIGHPSPRLPDQGLNDDLKYLMSEAGLDPAQFDQTNGQVRKAIQQAKRRRAAERGLAWASFTDGQLTDDLLVAVPRWRFVYDG